MSEYRLNIIRAIFLLLVQILIFNFVKITWFSIPFIEVFVYPLIVMLLPLRTPASVVIVIGFAMGLIVDIFQNTPGVHSGAGAFSGLVRPYVINYLAPRGGYKVNISPMISTINLRWFLKYAAVMITLYCFAVSLIDIFQLKLVHYMLLRTVLSATISYVVVMIIMIVFDQNE
ncbi:MAG TPA: hypothetical protein VKZ54_02540 [Membranihabitans sp.]|nr:hypothetical protein [Membranihabitans sp.]